MVRYTFSYDNPNAHYISIEVNVPLKPNTEEKLQIHLPSWRPGRYELGNFAKNMKNFHVLSENGNPIPVKKISKDCWEINQLKSFNTASIFIKYDYYAAEINAGSSYLDEKQLYVNPVNCCVFIPEMLNEIHEVELKLHKQFKLACSLPHQGNKLRAKNFDELADSPFIVSDTIQTFKLNVKDVDFHLHFQGECWPNFTIIENDFKAFCTSCINFFDGIHVKEYHFIFQVLPYPFYHGVEHVSNTVIALGPGYNLMKWDLYKELLGVSCHELFHTWNVKTIRPLEMLPYDFKKENYARTGFVYEGFTTYYGDKLLFTSGVFDEKEYFETLEERLNKHFHNYGRFNLSVADSSFDTWLDGYVQGAPYRKTSIYDEGCLIAFMLDVYIMSKTQNKNSLQNVLRVLYNEFYKKGKGYSEDDIVSIVENVSASFDNAQLACDTKEFFHAYVFGKNDFRNQLDKSFAYLGLELKAIPNSKCSERIFGFKFITLNNVCTISAVAPESPAWNKGLFINDEVLSINGFQVRNNLEEWLNYFVQKGETIRLIVSKSGSTKEVFLNSCLQSTVEASEEKTYYPMYKIINTSKEQANKNYIAWSKSE